MNIICIVGSPHGIEGNTFRLTEHVIDGIRNEGGRVDVALLDGMVTPCKGCDTCHHSGICPINDGFETLRNAIEEADGLLLVSPNYIQSVTAQMKAFMDRCSGTIHRLGFEGKYGASIVTSGGGDDAPIVDYMNRFLMMTGIRPVGGVHAAMASMRGGEFTAAVRQEAATLGKTLVKAWRDKWSDPDMDGEMAAFKERMRQLVVWKKEEWPFEFGYWQDHQGMA